MIVSKCKDCLHFDVCERYDATADFDVDDGVCLYYEHQIVRCKDCRYSYETFGFVYCTKGVCVDCAVPEKFYCAEGKRRTDNEAD